MESKFFRKKNGFLKITAIFALLLLIVIYACEKEFIESPPEVWVNSTYKATLENAKAWYDENKPEELCLRASEEKEKILMKPDWKQAFANQNEKYEVVECDLSIWGMFSFTMPECMEKYNETGDIRYKLSYTRLVLRTDKATKKTVGFLMTIVPNVEYLEKSNFKPFKKICYVDRLKNFGGEILFHNLDGSFSNGYIYEKGKITGAIKEMDMGQAEFELRSSVCYRIDYFLNTWNCPYWYQGSEEGYAIVCTLESQALIGSEYYCYDDGSSGNDYNNQNSSGGGSTPPPTPPPPTTPPNDPCVSGVAGNSNNNTMLSDSKIISCMNNPLQAMAKNSNSEYAVSVGMSNGIYSVSALKEGTATSGYIPDPPPGTAFVATGHSHNIGSIGVPSSGDLYTFLELVRDNPSMQTMYVYGTGYQIVNDTTVKVPETYAINVSDRAAVAAFLAKYPRSANLMNGQNGWVPGTELYTKYEFGKKWSSQESYPFLSDAAALSYIMSYFNIGVTLSRKVNLDSFKIVNAKQESPTSTTVSVSTCN